MPNPDENGEKMDIGVVDSLSEPPLDEIDTPRNSDLVPSGSAFVRVERLFGVDNGYDGDTRERNPIISISASPVNPHLIATGGREGTVRLWLISKESEPVNPASAAEVPMTEAKQLTTLSGHSGQVNAVRFSPSGEYLGTCSADATVRVYSQQQGGNGSWRLAHSLRFHSLDVTDVTWISSTLLVSTSTDRNTVVWDVVTGGRLQTMYSDQGSSCPKGVLGDPKGEYLCVMFDEGYIDVYRRNFDGKFRLSRHVDLGKEDSKNFSRSLKSTLYARRAAWSPSGDSLLLPLGMRARHPGPCGVEYERHNLLGPTPGEELKCSKIFLGHTSRVVVVAIRPQMMFLHALSQAPPYFISAMVSVDGVVSLWSSSVREKPIAVIANIASPMTVCTDAVWSNETLFLALSDGSVTLIHLNNAGIVKAVSRATIKPSCQIPIVNPGDVKSNQVELRVGGKRKIQPVVALAPELNIVLKSVRPDSLVQVKRDSLRSVSSVFFNDSIVFEINDPVSSVGHNRSLVVLGLADASVVILVEKEEGNFTRLLAERKILLADPASFIHVTSDNKIALIVNSAVLSLWQVEIAEDNNHHVTALTDDIPLVNFLRQESITNFEMSTDTSVLLTTSSGKRACYDPALRKWIAN